jgi:hypothetical protein
VLIIYPFKLPVAVFHNKTFNGTAYTVTTKDKTLKKEFSKYDYCPTKPVAAVIYVTMVIEDKDLLGLHGNQR